MSQARGDSLRSRWETTFSDRPSGPLTIAGQLLVYPGTKKKIRFLSCDSGSVKGVIRLPGPSSTGLLVHGEQGLTGLRHRRNLLLGIRLEDQKTLWRTPFRDPIPGSILKSGRWIVGSTEGMLVSVDAESGEFVWKCNLGDRLAAGPSLLNDTLIVQPGRNGAVHAVHAETGKILFSRTFEAPVVSAVPAATDWYAVDVSGIVRAFHATDSLPLWQRQLSGGGWSSPTISEEQLFLASSKGTVESFDRSIGERLWSWESFQVVTAPLTIVGDRLLVASKRGTLFLLNCRDGALLDSVSIVGGISQSPVSDGSAVYIASDLGRVACFDL